MCSSSLLISEYILCAIVDQLNILIINNVHARINPITSRESLNTLLNIKDIVVLAKDDGKTLFQLFGTPA